MRVLFQVAIALALVAVIGCKSKDEGKEKPADDTAQNAGDDKAAPADSADAAAGEQTGDETDDADEAAVDTAVDFEEEAAEITADNLEAELAKIEGELPPEDADEKE